MSRIPEFTRTILPDRAVGGAAIDVARQPFQQKADNIGQVTREATSALNNYAEVNNRVKQAESMTSVNESAINFKMKAADLETQMRQQRASNPDGFHKDFDGELTKLSDEYLKSAPNEYARIALKDTLDRQRASAYEQNQGWEITRKTELLGASVEKSTDDISKLAYERGLKGQPIDDLYNDADATTVAGSSFVAPDKLEKLNRSMRSAVTEARLKGLASVDPVAAERELRSMSQAHSSFSQADTFVAKQEGGYADNDGGSGAPVNFGINQKANPDIDVKTLTPEKAQEIRKTRYWDAIGAEGMSAPLAAVAYDGAINQGVGYMKTAIAEAGGDPMKLLDLREARYREIAKNPEKAKYLPVWLDRLELLKKQVQTQTQFAIPEGGTPQNTPGMVQAGNINLFHRPAVKNADGTVSSVRSISVNIDGRETLIPTVSEDGRIMSNAEAIETAVKTGKNLGTFDSPEAATKYADSLHEAQANMSKHKPGDELSYDKIVSLRTSIQAEQKRQIELRNEDPVSYMQTRGEIPDKPLDVSAPDFTLQVRQRENAARINAGNNGGDMPILNKAEAKFYSDKFAQQSTAQNLASLDMMRKAINSPRVYRDTLNQIRPDSPVVAMAGMYLQIPNTMKIGDSKVTPYQVAQDVLDGENLLNPTKGVKKTDGTKSSFPMPPDKGGMVSTGMREIFTEYTGNAFGGRPEEEAQAYQAFRAHYAANAARKGIYTGALDEDIAKASVAAITGGIAEKSDRSYILPWGMEEDVFVDAAQSQFEGMRKQFPAFFGGTEWNDVALENTGEPGKYRMIVGSGYLHDAGGIPLTLKMGS